MRPSPVRRLVPIVAVTAILAACAPGAHLAATSPDLSDTYGCGYGFYVGTHDQTAGLFLLSNLDLAEAASASGTFRLPGDEWTGDLSFGRDLFANWCDDVIEPGEPEPVVEETWQVKGVLQVMSLPTVGECGEARAALQQAVAVGPDGSMLELGDLDLINESWGCLAG